MDKFIYVFTKEAFDKLITDGYTLLKADNENLIFVFENSGSLKFGLTDDEFVFSSTLTF